MYMYTQGHSRIVSTGIYLPEQRVTSSELLQQIDSLQRFSIPYDWLDRAMGVRERRVAPDDMLPSTMAACAAKDALQSAGMDSKDLDAVIFTGVDRDYLEPATSHLVQNALDARNAIAFDLTNACHGFMNGIHLMDALIATGQVRYGLVVTGEHCHRIVRKAIQALTATTDRSQFMNLVGGLTLGDAGAAMIMGPKLGPDSGFMGFMLQSQGQYSDLCVCGNHRGEEDPLKTDMAQIVSRNTEMHRAMFGQFMGKLGWNSTEIASFVHHQVGKKVFRHHSLYSNIPLEKMPNTFRHFGNLVTATVPVNLHFLYQKQEVNSGDKVFLSGSGSGLSISQVGLIWDAA